MPRQVRIEYEGAFYHVMNRGRGRRIIFHSNDYYQAFIDTLEAACERFGGVVHAYCLMGNHYHLLIETPLANLGRIMRHINGVYTQHHNRMKRTDGPLFRGRYKAILVEADNYLLQLTRYIHRNPIETRTPIVTQLTDYPWSSYPAYINAIRSPPFLEREKTYQMLGSKQKYKGYAEFVHQGIDADLAKYYGRGNIASVIGSKHFITWLHDEILPNASSEKKAKVTYTHYSMKDVVNAVANDFHQTPDQLKKMSKGPNSRSEARQVAMYLSQQIAGETLQAIADCFGMGHRGSVSYATHQIKQRLQQDTGLRKRIDRIIHQL